MDERAVGLASPPLAGVGAEEDRIRRELRQISGLVSARGSGMKAVEDGLDAPDLSVCSHHDAVDR